MVVVEPFFGNVPSLLFFRLQFGQSLRVHVATSWFGVGLTSPDSLHIQMDVGEIIFLKKTLFWELFYKLEAEKSFIFRNTHICVDKTSVSALMRPLLPKVSPNYKAVTCSICLHVSLFFV